MLGCIVVSGVKPTMLEFFNLYMARCHIRRSQVIALLLCLFCSTSSSLAAVSEPDQPERQGIAQECTELRVLLKEAAVRSIDLERYYLQYTLIANDGPKWRWLRYPVLQNTGASCSLSGHITALSERAKNFESPQNVSKRVLKGARVTGLIGNIVLASSSGIELGSNGLWALKNKIHKNDPGTAKRIFIQKLHGLDESLQLLDKRLAQCGTEPSVEIIATESKLLRIYRDWNVYEFAQFYADIKSRQSSNSLFYALNEGANCAEAVAYILLLKALKGSVYAGPSSICSLIDDCISLVNAPVRNVAHNILYKFYFKKVGSELHETLYNPKEAVAAECVKLQHQVATADRETLELVGQVDKRLSTYSLYNSKYEDYYRKTMSHLRYMRRIALQGNEAGITLSTGSLASDIQGALSYYPFREQNKTSNALGFSGATTAAVVTGANLYLNTRWLFRSMLYTAQLKREHRLPEEILADRLKTLSDIEQVINLPSKKPADSQL